MAKINANLADISTEYKLPDPGPYVLRVKEINVENKKAKAVGGDMDGQEIERTTYVVKSVIVRDLDGNEDNANKPIWDYINIHNKDGSLNEISLANLKRYFEAIAPDSANSEDADTDELINGEYQAQVYHETYDKGGEERTSAKIRPSTIQPVAA